MSTRSFPEPIYAPLDFVRLEPDEQRERLRAFHELMSPGGQPVATTLSSRPQRCSLATPGW